MTLSVLPTDTSREDAETITGMALRWLDENKNDQGLLPILLECTETLAGLLSAHPEFERRLREKISELRDT